MNPHQATLLEVINHALRKHPELIDGTMSLCHSVRGSRDEFRETVRKWFEARGDQTLRLEYDLSPESIVFDLGGYHGDFAQSVHDRFGCHVYVYEPVKAYYEACVERFRANPKIRVMNYGLSDSEAHLPISLDADGSSLVRSQGDSPSEVVQVKSLSGELDRLRMSQIDLLKVNIEGGEFALLAHMASHGLLSAIRHLQVQFHAFVPDSWKMRDDLRMTLARTHRESWNYPFVWESWQRVDRDLAKP